MKSAEGTPNTAFLQRMLDGPLPKGGLLLTWIFNRAREMSAFAGPVSVTTAIMQKLKSEGRSLDLKEVACQVVSAYPPSPPT